MDQQWLQQVATEVAGVLAGAGAQAPAVGWGGPVQGGYGPLTQPGKGGVKGGGKGFGPGPGPGRPVWACSCGTMDNWATRLNCRVCLQPRPGGMQQVLPVGPWAAGPGQQGGGAPQPVQTGRVGDGRSYLQAATGPGSPPRPSATKEAGASSKKKAGVQASRSPVERLPSPPPPRFLG